MKHIREYVNPEIKDVIFLYSYKILDVGVKEVYIGCIRENTPYHDYCFIPRKTVTSTTVTISRDNHVYTYTSSGGEIS